MYSKVALVLLLAAAGAQAGTPYTPGTGITFCQRYTAALFTTATCANEQALIAAVVSRATGGSNGTAYNNIVVTGILNTPSQIAYFNGTHGDQTNFYTNTAAATTLVGKLNTFFQWALECNECNPTYTDPIGTIHAQLSIEQGAYSDFIGQLVATMNSFGVAAADVTYAAALLGIFGRNAATPTLQICSAANCNAATGFAEFSSGVGSDGSTYAWVQTAPGTAAGTSSTTVNVAVGSNVHWNIGAIHNVVQTDSTFTTLAGGWTSGGIGATGTFTQNFPTAGTYYFKCGAHAYMTGTIVVGGTTPSSASSVVASVGVVLAAVAAAVVAKRF
jgi:plastocyanin